jgi:2-polyprenyl-3-methyl-5-hydroxy-6-metoxy-1,4-benzoquinol methylase
MDENTKTLQTYNSKINDYIAATPKVVTGDVKIWLDKSLSFLKPGSTILEIGSAFGRDATYIAEQGFRVYPTDASEKFVDFMKAHNIRAKLLNAITDSLDGPYNMIYANAVLVHFTVEQTEKVLDKIHDVLKKGGIFAFRIKRGDGNEWSSEKVGGLRYYQYWQPEEIAKLVNKHNFELIELTKGSSDFNDFKWLQVIARKK